MTGYILMATATDLSTSMGNSISEEHAPVLGWNKLWEFIQKVQSKGLVNPHLTPFTPQCVGFFPWHVTWISPAHQWNRRNSKSNTFYWPKHFQGIYSPCFSCQMSLYQNKKWTKFICNLFGLEFSSFWWIHFLFCALKFYICFCLSNWGFLFSLSEVFSISEKETRSTSFAALGF